MDEILRVPRLFMEELSRPFLQREEQARLITIALMTKEHLVMIGEPGTAKSALVRRAAELLNAKFFLYLLTKYTEPAELFGPIDVVALKNGVYKRITENRLLDAQVVFLDEIFNANSSILNTLLSIINERVVYDQTQIQVPLWSLFAATNRVPDETELEALYDRLLIREFVRPLDETLWTSMLKKGLELEYATPKAERKFSLDEFRQIYEILPKVNVDGVIPKIPKILIAAHEKEIGISDRRKGKLLKIIAANALIEGRSYATEDDLMILKNIFAKDMDDYEKINTILTELIQTTEKYMREFEEIQRNLKVIDEQLSSSTDTRLSVMLPDLLKSLKTARERVEIMSQGVSNENVLKKSDEIIQFIDTLLARVAKIMGLTL